MGTKKKNGRPLKITAAVVEEVGKLMALGMPEEHACALADVNPATFGPAVSRNPKYKAIMLRHHAGFLKESLEYIRDGGKRVMLQDGEDKDGNPVMVEKVLPWNGRAWIMERRYNPFFNKTYVTAPGDKDAPASGTLSEADALLLEAAMKRRVREQEGKQGG